MKKLICFLGVFAFASIGWTQQPLTPLGLKLDKTFTVNLGYSHDYAKSTQKLYYKFTYDGKTLKEKGTAPSLAGPSLDFTPPSLSDDSDISLKLEDGIGNVTGPLFEGIGLKPFNLKGDLFKYLRGTIQVNGRVFSDAQVNIAAGLETIPITPLKFLPGTPNVIRFGVLGEKASNPAVAKESDLLLFTARAYAGTGFLFLDPGGKHLFVKSQRLATLQKQVEGMVESNVTIDDVKSALARVGSGQTSADNPLDQFVQFAGYKVINGELQQTVDQRTKTITSDEEVQAYIRSKLDMTTIHKYLDKPDQPRFLLQGSMEAAYAPIKFDTRRYNALYLVSFDIFVDPRNPDTGKLSFGYQNGYNRSAPTDALTGFIASFGMKF